MTLKLCRDCGHEVSPDAEMCPNCGCKTPARAKSNFAGWLVFIISLGVIAALIRKYVVLHFY
jgi:RNA polymerase subunit RPABC4/transcription elongation factor Spt4